jgi:phosphoglycolate phosphatase
VIEAVLFDLDGTFADTAADLGAALNHVRDLHQLPPLPLEALRPQASHGSAGLLKIGMNVTPDDPVFPNLRESFLNYYTAHICDHTKLFPGMAMLIDELDLRGVSWGIVTNKPHRFTVPLIQALGYDQRVACLVSGDTCEYSKPHPMPLLHASRLIGVIPRHCLYLGDDLRDMEAAQAASMTGIIAAYGYIDPTTDTSVWPAYGNVVTPLALLRFLTL